MFAFILGAAEVATNSSVGNRVMTKLSSKLAQVFNQVVNLSNVRITPNSHSVTIKTPVVIVKAQVVIPKAMVLSVNTQFSSNTGLLSKLHRTDTHPI